MKIAASSLSLSIVCGLIAGVTACGGKQSESDGSLKTIAPVVDVADEQEEVICLAPGVEKNAAGDYVCDQQASDCAYRGPAGLAEITANKCSIIYGRIILRKVNGPDIDPKKSNYPNDAALTNLDALSSVKEVRNYLLANGREGDGGVIALFANNFLTNFNGLAHVHEVRQFVAHFSATSMPRNLNLDIRKADLISIETTQDSGLKEIYLGFEQLQGLAVDKTSIERIFFTASEPVYIGRGLKIRGNPYLVQIPDIGQLALNSFERYAFENPFDQLLMIRTNPRLCQVEALSAELWINRFPFMPTHHEDGPDFELLANNCTE